MLQWMQRKFISVLILKAVTITTIILVAVFLYFPTKSGWGGLEAVHAQSIADPNSELQTGVNIISEPLGLPATDIRLVVANIIRIALGLLGIIAVVLMIYAGYLWMTAGGNDEQIGTAKKFLINTAIGLAIILSAYAIVSFVISKLIDATTGTGGAGDGSNLDAPISQNFQGSGALGRVIKDHYPTRDQVGVPRNTRIVITFRRPIKADSFIDEASGDTILGNCKTTVENWYSDCDHLKPLSDSLINISRADNDEKISGAVVLASSSTIDGVSGIFTIVIKPITDVNLSSGGYLGSATEPVSYIVRLGSGLRLDDPANDDPSVFSSGNLGNNFYEWKFTNSTALDTSPPSVDNVFPAIGSTEARNSILQINFSEPVDPTGIQGIFNIDGEYYTLDGQNIFLKSNHSSLPLGNFNLTNGYRTLEFAPSQECGKNACGNKIYCLPVCDNTGAACNQDNYEVLLRAAKTVTPGSFESQPFSGITDLAGNALDGNKNNVPNTASNTLPVFPNQKQPDNYFWGFIISNQIDATSPFIQTIVPGIDAENITREQELSFIFSKRMRAESLYSIGIEEKPIQAVPIWKVPSTVFSTNTTFTRLNHGPFLDGIRQYYFPVVSSSVEDAHFNCFYPGKGPNQAVGAGTIVSKDCTDATNCCAVVTAQNQSFCCNGAVGASMSSTSACLDHLKGISL